MYTPAQDPLSSNLPINQQRLVTPLRPFELERELASYPVSQLLRNISSHHLVYTHTRTLSWRLTPRNAWQVVWPAPTLPHHPFPISIAPAWSPRRTGVVEISTTCLHHPVAASTTTPQPLPNLCCSGLGVVPKKDWGCRDIYHLFAPPGSSINDFIDPDSFSLHYCTIDAAIAILNTLGPGALMGKIDLKNAFHLLLVRREDWHLLGIHWQGQWYVDKCLQFGLRLSPALFNHLASAIESTTTTLGTSSTTRRFLHSWPT